MARRARIDDPATGGLLTSSGTTTTEGTPRRRGRPPRTAEQRAAQRVRLIEGAIEAIRAGGPDQSLEDIAASIGVSKPVLYDEFGGRLGLADAIAVVLAERLQRTVIDRLTASGSLAVSDIIRTIVDALVRLVEKEPQIYAFIVRTLRSDERRLLDNALVQVLHERTAPLVAAAAPGVSPDALSLLTDGVYGFVFAAIESWQTTKRPSRDRMVRLVSAAITEGLKGAVDDSGR